MERQVVMDAGVAIRLKQLHKFGTEIYTTAGVLREVREKQAKTMLAYLPCELQVRHPTPEDVAFVRSFAKKTGDLGFLSQNDIDIIALTLMLQRQTGDVALLNKTPKVLAFDRASHRHTWAPEAVKAPTPSLSSAAKPALTVDGWTVKNVRKVDKFGESDNVKEHTLDATNTLAADKRLDGDVSEHIGATDTLVADWLDSSLDDAPVEHILGVEDASTDGSALVELDVMDDVSSTDGSEAGEWVTSENLCRFNVSVENEKEEKVTCVTTDYSVQNVLMQIGLHVTSIDGYRIRNLKTWGLLCRACGTSTRDTTKLWCPKCGHATVDRVPVTVDSETGQMTVHDNRRRRNFQGHRYSVPNPKGGRHRGPIFAEDELMMGGRMREIRRAQKLLAREKLSHDPFGGATGNENQWCQRHVTSSGNHINQFEAKIVVGYGRRNPNANNFHKHTGNKKKRR